jgi:hypothetical protein
MPRLSLRILVCGILCLQTSCKGPSTRIHTVSGSYWSNSADPYTAELQSRGNCAYEKDGKVFVSRSSLSELNFKDGLATICTEQFGWLFVKQDGSTVPTVTFDNGPDYFSEGLARYVDDGKTGFIDKSGKIIIAAKFGFASPFGSGYSEVCNDLVMEADGEHQFVRSNHWGLINKKGRIVLPMKFSRQEIRAKIVEIYQGEPSHAANSASLRR